MKAGFGADTILDFEEGIDSLQLADNLTFDRLLIISINGAIEIKVASNNKVLATLIGIQAEAIASEDFAVF